MRPTVRWLAWCFGLALLTACRTEVEEPGPHVAKGRGVSITVGELEAKLGEHPPATRARLASPEQRKQLLENLIRFDLLAHEAEARHLERDPEVREAIRGLLVQRLVRQVLDGAGGAAASEAEARAHYEAHLTEYVTPERLRVAHLFFRGAPGSPERARAQAGAERALARLRLEGPRNPLAFANLARDLSEDPASRPAGGDLGALTAEELKARWSAEFAAAAAALREPGQTSGVVGTPAGYHLLKLVGRQPGLTRRFEEVRDQLMARLGRDRRVEELERFVSELRRKAEVQVDEVALERVTAAGPTSAR